MTEKQIEKVRSKIAKYKKTLATDKKYHYGFYDDSQGIRYQIPQLYITIEDYKGCQRYFTWFRKNFPDDIGYPVFLFE